MVLEYQLKYVNKFRVYFILVMHSQLPLILIYLHLKELKMPKSILITKLFDYENV